MGSTALSIFGSIIVTAIVVTVVIFLLVPVIKGIRWLIIHLFRFVAGMLGDALRFIGAIITSIVFIPLVLLNVIIGRWSAAAHFGRGLQTEARAAAYAIYRVVISHPARLLMLSPMLEGVEQRIPDAVARAPGSDKPSRRTGQFEGYEIVGSLQGGGSGGRLYVAKPDAKKLAAFVRAGQREVQQVVIKSFSLADGSSLPQMIRESRALEAAKNLGLILDHELTDERFFYVMRYIPGDDLTTITKRLHAEAGTEGLNGSTLLAALGHLSDLLTELDTYHRGGLWHKDVKPDNIIISGGRGHLVDLGLVTPLRSAMTLTTHGTEYFRDPEMVRMALRGAKVNEVDGVKFDLYAVGAVLYSVVENSFPAHGALSQITKRCPEAVRWITRRLMADMQHRYASASAALADLRTVMNAPDPFALKPIDLPSVRGGEQPEIREPQAEPFAMPVGHAAPGAAVAGAGVGAAARHEGAAVERSGFIFDVQTNVGGWPRGRAASPVPPAAAGAGAQPRTKPKLVVSDWLTGRYTAAEAPGPFAAGDDPFGRAADQVARAAGRFGKQAEPYVRRAAGTAAEQLARAQDRIKRAQERAAQRMGRRAKRREFNNRPNAGVAAAAFIFLAACVGGVFTIVNFALQKEKSGVSSIDLQGEVMSMTFDNGSATRGITVQRGSFESSSVMSMGPDMVISADHMADGPSHAEIEAQHRMVSSTSPAIEPVEHPKGTILVVDALPVDLKPERRQKLWWTIETLNHAGYRILGLGNSKDEIDLVAEAKGEIGLGTPTDKDTRARLSRWVQEQADAGGIEAVLWAWEEDKSFRMVVRKGFDSRALEKTLRTASKQHDDPGDETEER